jgi:hypothetical protein
MESPKKLQFACSCEWRGANCRGMPNSDCNDTSKRSPLRSSSIRMQSSSGTISTQPYINPLSSPWFIPLCKFHLIILTLMCLEASSPYFITQCPATCELCSHWLPNHSVSHTCQFIRYPAANNMSTDPHVLFFLKNSCPRKGVHPSQWSMSPSFDDETFETCEEQVEQASDDECWWVDGWLELFSIRFFLSCVDHADLI